MQGNDTRRQPLVIGSMCVRNEDVFVEQAIRNVAAFCDRIVAVDHVSTDGTTEILRRLAREYDHLDVRRAKHSRVAHELLEPYAGTNAWVLRVDGDELYDPDGLETVREWLDEGGFATAFRVQSNVLHCTELDRGTLRASGHLSPPSRPITALYNFGATTSWTGCVDRLMGGDVIFRPGFAWDTIDVLPDRFGWDDSPLRYLHTCFLRRSSLDPEATTTPRLSLGELGTYRRGALGGLVRLVRGSPVDPKVREIHARGSTWKLEKYRRGPLVEKDVGVFFAR
jgi:glycosyltransferase involved in cell wall biosynthesis